MKKLLIIASILATIVYTGYSQTPELKISINQEGLMMVEPVNNSENTFFGILAGQLEDPLSLGNTYIGRWAGKEHVFGSQNTFIGKSAGQNASMSGGNTYLGAESGSHNIQGSDNVFVGYQSGTASNGYGNVFIGKLSGENEQGNEKLFIENSGADFTGALIYGEFDSNKLRFNAQTAIYTDSAPDHGLYVEKNHSGDSDLSAIKGENAITDFYGIGVEGIGGWQGVRGTSIGNSGGSYYGVYGSSTGSNFGSCYGIYGIATTGEFNYGVYGASDAGSKNYAGYFSGKVKITDIVQVSTNGIQFSDTETGFFDDDEIINKTTPLKYYIATDGAFPSSSSGSNDGKLLGEIKLLPYAFVPSGWLPCEGQLLNITNNSSLYSLLGINYGGDGQTTFALPDMRNAVPNHN